MLQNDDTLAKIGDDTAEDESLRFRRWFNSSIHSPPLLLLGWIQLGSASPNVGAPVRIRDQNDERMFKECFLFFIFDFFVEVPGSDSWQCVLQNFCKVFAKSLQSFSTNQWISLNYGFMRKSSIFQWNILVCSKYMQIHAHIQMFNCLSWCRLAAFPIV